MKKRILGKTNQLVSEISLGTWQLGNAWGKPFDLDLAHETLYAAFESDINCLDTADVYSSGLSEKTIGSFYQNKKKPYIITKIGRRSNPHNEKSYTYDNLLSYINDSRNNLKQAQLDLVLLHCPPGVIYDNGRTFKIMDDFVSKGLIKHYGVSVETVEEAYKALEYENIAAIEIIFNMFRLKPSEAFFLEAKEKNVGIIVRVPLASGLLTGKYDINKRFSELDHRHFNREGQAFDKGETFSGVDYAQGLKAVDALKEVFPGYDLAQIALRYILMFDAVSTVIPGASRPEQVYSNVKAANLLPLTEQQMSDVEAIYDHFIKASVHHLW